MTKNKKLIRQQLRNYPTPQEIILWARLRKKQLGFKFRRQHSFGNYIVDFYCPAKKVAIEVDGAQHKEPGHEEYDRLRTTYLEGLGIKVIRFWNNDVDKNLSGVILKIESNL